MLASKPRKERIGMYTIRQCIEEMRRFGTNTIYLYNGTTIYLLEMNADRYEQIGTFKRNEDGSIRVMRRIVCRIIPSENTRMLDDIKKNRSWYLYAEKLGELSYFGVNDYILPERVMNQFISYNGGIDHYRTIGELSYIYDDIMSICE